MNPKKMRIVVDPILLFGGSVFPVKQLEVHGLAAIVILIATADFFRSLLLDPQKR